VPCPFQNSSPVTQCTTLLLLLCLCLSRQDVSWLLDVKRENHSLASHFSNFIPLDYFFWGFVKDIVYHEKVWNMNEFCGRIIRAAEYITSEITPNTWWETECHLDVFCATNGGHIVVYWAHKKLSEVHSLKIYWFVQYTSWLRIYNIIFYFILFYFIIIKSQNSFE